MKCSFSHAPRCLVLCLGLMIVWVPGFAQERVLTPPGPSKPINLDKELETPVATDRAASYYHYSLSKWYENDGDVAKALSEMQTALKYNQNSAGVHLEMAALLEKAGNTPEAIENAEEAARLDPQDPDPHWLLANIYFRPQERGNASDSSLQKAIQELEKIVALSPRDERAYYALGSAYFAVNKPEKAIAAYEKFQSLSTNADNGYREIAKYYERTGNDEKAIEYLTKGLKVQPDSAESMAMLAVLYSKQNKNKEAIPLYKKLAELTGNNVNVTRDLAAALVENGENADALKVLDDLAKNPSVANDSGLQTLRGKALFGLKKFTEALSTFQTAAEDPKAIEARFYIGRVYEETSKYEDAAKVFEKLLESTSGSGDEMKTNRLVFQQHLAANYLEMGNHDKAIAIYQEMAKTDPKRANPQLLNAYRVGKNFDKAIPLGRDLYTKDPSDIEIGVIYARTLADAGRPKEGADVLGKLLQSNPDNIEIYVNLSQVYLQDKRYADAEKVLRRAEDKTTDSQNNERLKIQLAAVYEKQKDFDRAESIFKEILKVNPQNAVALNYIGYMLADRGVRLDEAVRYVKEALAIDPQNGAYLDSLGWAFFKLNDLENAERYLLEADQIVKDDPTIDEHLGDLYFKTGNLAKAEEFWKRSVSIGTEQEDVQKVRRKLEMLQENLRKPKTAK